MTCKPTAVFNTCGQVYSHKFCPEAPWLPGCILKANGTVSSWKTQGQSSDQGTSRPYQKCPLAQVQTQPPQSSTPTAQSLFNKVYKATQARSPGAGDPVKPEMTGIQQGTENGNVMYFTASTKQHINIHSYNNNFIWILWGPDSTAKLHSRVHTFNHSIHCLSIYGNMIYSQLHIAHCSHSCGFSIGKMESLYCLTTQSTQESTFQIL